MVVTVSREYGAGGLAVAGGVAAALGYELMTDAIPETVAARLGASCDDVRVHAESEPPLADRILADLGAGTPEMGPGADPDPFDESVRREIERAIRERAARGDVVILGRVGNAVLAGTAGLLRAFVYADRDWRVRRIAGALGLTPERAAAEVDRVDLVRRRFAADRYRIAWGDRRSYDVIVDTARVGIEGAVEAIAAAARSTRT
jgi:cytidylate kinase